MQAKKKKKKTNTPTRHTMTRARRLQAAKSWMGNYEGKNLVQGYAKRYRTDLLCAIAELRILGVEIKAAYEQAVRKTIEQRIVQSRLKKEVKLTDEEMVGNNEYQDGEFAFISGYTSGGVTYGIRWDDVPNKDI